MCYRSGRANILQSKSQTNNLRQGVVRSPVSTSFDSEPISVRAIRNGNKIMMTVSLDQIQLDMPYDPGAAKSVISYSVRKKIRLPLLQAVLKLVAYSGVPVKTSSKTIVSRQAFNRTLTLPTISVEDDYYSTFWALFGVSWLLAFIYLYILALEYVRYKRREFR